MSGSPPRRDASHGRVEMRVGLRVLGEIGIASNPELMLPREAPVCTRGGSRSRLDFSPAKYCAKACSKPGTLVRRSSASACSGMNGRLPQAESETPIRKLWVGVVRLHNMSDARFVGRRQRGVHVGCRAMRIGISTSDTGADGLLEGMSSSRARCLSNPARSSSSVSVVRTPRRAWPRHLISRRRCGP